MDDVLIGLSRGPCFGNCPIYQVSLSGTGEVLYNGIEFVRVVGARTATVDIAEVERLVMHFLDIGFDDLPDCYPGTIDDMPRCTIMFRHDGHTKQLEEFGLSSIGMPETIIGLEKQIERIAGTARWL